MNKIILYLVLLISLSSCIPPRKFVVPEYDKKIKDKSLTIIQYYLDNLGKYHFLEYSCAMNYWLESFRYIGITGHKNAQNLNSSIFMASDYETLEFIPTYLPINDAIEGFSYFSRIVNLSKGESLKLERYDLSITNDDVIKIYLPKQSLAQIKTDYALFIQFPSLITVGHRELLINMRYAFWDVINNKVVAYGKYNMYKNTEMLEVNPEAFKNAVARTIMIETPFFRSSFTRREKLLN